MKNRLNLALLGAVLFLVAGCAGRGAIYVQPAYTKETLPPLLVPEGRLVPVAVATFEDGRPIKDKIGLRRSFGGQTDSIQYGGPSLEEMVTRALASQLKRSGFDPQAVSPWDLRKETMPKLTQDYLFGGRLDYFWAEVTSGWSGTNARVRVEVTVILASPKEGRVLWQNSILSSSELRELFFSNEELQDAVSSAFSTAMNRILRNPELQEIIGKSKPR